VRFPVTIRHRGSKVKIYAPAGKFAYYHLAYTLAGKRRMQTFAACSNARQAGERLVRDLANGSQAAGFSANQSRDALAAMQRLEAFRQSTGRRMSLLAAVSEWVEQSTRLNGRPLPEAVDGFLANVASVKRKDIGEAVEEFIKAEDPRTKASEGQRAQLSPKYAYNRAIMLRRFAKAFPGHAVCDMTKEHLDAFLTSETVSAFSAKSRNHHRATVKQWLEWTVRKDYLPVTHRRFKSSGPACRSHQGDPGGRRASLLPPHHVPPIPPGWQSAGGFRICLVGAMRLPRKEEGRSGLAAAMCGAGDQAEAQLRR
jgi:hypothetical protein